MTAPGDAGAARRLLVVETDGGARGNPGPAGYGAVVRDGGSGAVLAERAGFLGVATNNVAEYSGLVAGLQAAHDLDPEARVEVRADSRLVVEQMSGRWQIKHDDMRRLAAQARAAFPPGRVRYRWIPRAQNAAADALANEAMDRRVSVARDMPSVGSAGSGRSADSADDDSAGSPGHRGGPGGDDGAKRDGRAGGARGSGSGRDDGAGGARGDVAAVSAAASERALGAALHVGGGSPMTLVLVRHGQTDMTLARCYAGGDVPGVGLNGGGRIEAARAADLVHRIGRDAWPDLPRGAAVLSSSMLRARQTAAAIGRRLGLGVEVDDAFAECRFGAWEGLTAAEIEEHWPGALRRWHEDPDVRAAGGESQADVAARMRAAAVALLPDHAGRTVVVATHTVVIRAGVGSLTGMAPQAWSSIRVPPASLTILRLWPDGHELTVLGCPSDL